MKNKMLTLLSFTILIAALGLAGSHIYAENEEQPTIVFTDVSNHWAKETIGQAVAKGYVEGFPDGTFRPEEKVSRAQFTKMVAVALELPVTGETTGSNWYKPYADAAVKAGIHQSSDFKADAWNTGMIRNEMARMGARAIGEKTDDEKEWFYLATNAGLINGVDQYGTIAELHTMTRAQAVTVIERVLKVRAGEKLASDKRATSQAEILWHKTNMWTMLSQYFGRIDLNMSDKNLSITADKGNFACHSSKLVAIDMTDPNDPYRYILKNLKTTTLKDRSTPIALPKDGYALISINHLNVKVNNTNLSRVMSCYIDPYFKLKDANGNSVPVTQAYHFNDKNEYVNQASIRVKDVKDLSVTYYSGYILPKGDYSLDGHIVVQFFPFGEFPGVPIILF